MPATHVRRATGVVIVAMLVLSAASAFAQYGHPLSGSWSGDWGPTRENRNRVLLDLDWDGKAITGRINPGPEGIVIQKATVDVATLSDRGQARKHRRSQPRSKRHVDPGRREGQLQGRQKLSRGFVSTPAASRREAGQDRR
jgi:hypothetical protein